MGTFESKFTNKIYVHFEKYVFLNFKIDNLKQNIFVNIFNKYLINPYNNIQ